MDENVTGVWREGVYTNGKIRTTGWKDVLNHLDILLAYDHLI